MLGSSWRKFFTAGVVFLWLVGPAPAQDEEQRPARGYTAVFDHIDLLIDNYSRFLARKYDLTEEQDEYTKFLLRERSYEFLDEHEENLRVLIDRLFDVRTGGEMTQEELIEWGKSVSPIYEEAKKLIVGGNDEWREILTTEQRKTHDEDVKLMYQSFETTDDQISRIVSGEMTVEDFRVPQRHRTHTSQSGADAAPEPSDEPMEPGDERPRHSLSSSPRDEGAGQPSSVKGADQRGARTPRASAKPPARRGTENRAAPLQRDPDPRATRRDRSRPARGTPKANSKQPESQWEKYVREFIEKYKLNDEQSQKAAAVLEDCQTRADRHRLAHKQQVADFDKQIAELKKSKDKDKSKKVSDLTDKRKKLLDPIDRIFEQQLKPRLERLPTRAQRRAAESAGKKKTAAKKTPTKRPDKRSPGNDDE